MKFPRVETKYTKLGGGLDLETPAISVDPGKARLAKNYMAGSLGGFSRIDGYERFSGQPAPSDADYYYCPVTLTGSVSVGDTIVGDTSTATGVVVVVEDDYLVITKLAVSTFQAETFKVGGVPKGTITAVPTLNGCPIALDGATALAAAADNYRTDIAKPTGSGRVLGLGMLNGTLYCFRANAGDTATDMFKATASGWTQVTLYNEVSFTAGGASVPADGTTLTQGGVTATIKRVVTQSGSWGASSAAGRFIVTNPSGGNFAAGAATIGAITVTLSGVQTAITLTKGGKYRCIEYNFTGSTDTKRMYGCDGVNRAFEFDGTVYVPLVTGMTTDTPSNICAHKHHLVLGFRGSMQFSSIGDPYVWSPLTGAAEIGLGDTITGLLAQPGDVLAAFTRNATFQLTGSSVSDFALSLISAEVGAIQDTPQNIGYAYCLDDRGIVKITQSQAYGNFEQGTVSREVQLIIDTIRSLATCSSVHKTLNQYRIYGSDGTGVCMTIMQTSKGIKEVFTNFDYPDNIVCAYSGEDANGKDVVYLGSDDGWVFQSGKGSSFDGDAIEAYLRLPFNHLGSPAYLKTFREAQFEMEANGYTSIRIHPDYDYGGGSQHQLHDVEFEGVGGYWNVDNWESIYYDTSIVAAPEAYITGEGRNISMMVYSNSAIDIGHTLQGIIITYTVRRLAR